MRVSAFLRRDLLELSSYRMLMVWRVGSIVFSLTGLYLLARAVDAGTLSDGRWTGRYFMFAAVGLAMVDAMNTCIRGYNNRVRYDQMAGTLESLLSGGASLGQLIVVSGLLPVLIGCLRVVAYITAAFAIQSTVPAPAAVLSFVPVLLVSMAGFMVLGMSSAALTLVFRRGEPLSALFAGVSILLGGVVYPLDVLPVWAQKVALVLPLTHSMEAGRQALLEGKPITDMGLHFACLGGFMLCALLLLPLCLHLASRQIEKGSGLRGY